MATQIIEGTLPARQRDSARSGTLGDGLAPDPTASLFSLVREEPFVEAAPKLVHASRSIHARALQRCVDLTLAILCLLILAPVMLAVALFIEFSSPGPIFYSQPRFGRDGEVFGCLKFRTMLVDADRLLQEMLASSPAVQEIWTRDRKLRNDPRITPIGHFLRRYSLDELPQLINVLRGEMSIVGPRPLATDEAHFYAEAFSVYCSIKPGITGPWQVGGRNQTSFEARAKLDCEYARTKSLCTGFSADPPHDPGSASRHRFLIA